MKIFFYFSLAICLFAYGSCDILRLSPFEVTSWSPGEGYHSQPENIVVSLDFSHEPDRASVERNFSLNADGSSVRGVFLWEDKKVTFTPLSPLEKNVDYAVNLSANAYNTDRLNMDYAFNQNFTTRPHNVRPVLISCSPSMYERVGDLRTEVKLEFNVSVSIKTLYENVSFTPSMTGFWQLENDDTYAIFTPSEPWSKNTRYEIRLSGSLSDNNGNASENNFSGVFMTQIEDDAPYLVSANRMTKNGEFFLLSAEAENGNWEKDDRIFLVFSEPVEGLSIKNHVEIVNGPSFFINASADFKNEFIVGFETFPVYESRFAIKIKPGIKDASGNSSKNEHIYRIFANGMFSKPPALVGMRIPLAPRNNANQQLKYIGIDQPFEIIDFSETNYPFGESVKTWIELYFSVSEGASIDQFSIMELFRIETSNNVITFSPRLVKTSDFSENEPHTGMENFYRIEISGNFGNSTEFGIVHFLIAAGLRDSLGNQNDKPFRITFVK
ncbi:MAG: Ig-like domain-containing protein [Treponema sp.]|nr:Ig-like domain-containing protein [Treponema sp.]MCL2236797.1 Ig-like domain-containing protein [Treponema sp.]